MELNKIYNNDCLEVLKKFPDESIDLGLTDPPYQIEYIDMIAQQSYKAKCLEKETKPIKNDFKGSIDWDIFFDESYRILKPKKMLYMCCRLDMIVDMGHFIKRSKFKYSHDFVWRDFVWQKGDMGYGNLNIMGTTHELIIGLSKGYPEKSQPIKVDGITKYRTPAFYAGKLSRKEYYGHPTQKPVGMMAYIIQNRTKKNDVVLDSFAGSGSTLVASKLLDRNYIGIELDEDHYKNILKRLADKAHLNLYKNLGKGFISVKGGITCELGESSKLFDDKQEKIF